MNLNLCLNFAQNIPRVNAHVIRLKLQGNNRADRAFIFINQFLNKCHVSLLDHTHSMHQPYCSDINYNVWTLLKFVWMSKANEPRLSLNHSLLTLCTHIDYVPHACAYMYIRVHLLDANIVRVIKYVPEEKVGIVYHIPPPLRN